jgi:type II secretory pathway pseudopilin PulG
VEVLISVAIMAIVLAVFLAALSTSAHTVAEVHERVTAENIARAQLECIQHTRYIPGAAPISYTTACTATQLSSYPVSLTISYWVSPTFTITPTTASDLQWITVTVYHNSDPVFAIGNYKVNR